MRTISVLASIIACLIFECCPVSGQDTATIVGVVRDASGAAVPGVRVTIANAEKAFIRTVTTGRAGEYIAYALPIGNFTVSTQAAGLQPTSLNVQLTVGRVQRVDLRLEVGRRSERVTVEGEAPRVETENGAISATIQSREVGDLLLNGRNWTLLASLVAGANPGVSFDGKYVGLPSGVYIYFNGNRAEYNNWEIDGGPNADEGSSTNLNTYPVLASIAEFRISSSNYGAEIGRHSGATIELATKSGTRDFHAEAWEFLRNDAFDAQDWFLNRQGESHKRPLKWNDFGYTIGGPAHIPGIYNRRKDKTFFFWSEGWRRYHEDLIESAGVPSVRQRAGDFSECDPSSPNFNAVIASGCVLPSLGEQSFSNVRDIPGFQQQSYTNARLLLDPFVPLPNNGPTGWQRAAPDPTRWREEQIRIDQRLNDRLSLFVRYTQDTWNNQQPYSWDVSSFDTIASNIRAPARSAAAHLTTVIRPNLVNEFIAGFTMNTISYGSRPGDTPAGSLGRPSQFVMNHLFAGNDANPLMPSFIVCGGASYCFGEGSGTSPWHNANPVFTWKENLAWAHGPSTLKAGFFIERYRKNEQFGSQNQGTLQFFASGSVTTGNALADMFTGRISQYSEGSLVINGNAVGGYPKGHWRMSDFEPYVQADWKVTPRLALNLGLRYYFFTRMHDVTSPTVDSNFLPWQYDASRQAVLDANGNIVQGTGAWYRNFGNGLVQCGTNGVPAGCQLRNTGLNFAPRFGFALDLTGKARTVLRGGYGLYYEAGNGNEANSEGSEGNPPAAYSVTTYNVVGYDRIVAGAMPPTSYTAIPYSEKWPSLQQFNVSVQHQLGTDDIVQIAYVGSLGHHLARWRRMNQLPYRPGIMNAPALAGTDGCDAQGNCDVQYLMIHQTPDIFFTPYRGYSTIIQKENAANSSYNALQASYRHSLRYGLTVAVAYAWSHSIDNASSPFGGTHNFVDDNNAARWRASSDFDRRHVASVSYIFELPFFRKAPHALFRGALAHWQISGITTFMAGPPVTVLCGRAGYATGIGTWVTCNTAGKLQPHKSTYNDPVFGPTPQWFDPNVLQQITEGQLRADLEPGMFGYLGRNVLNGPGRNNFNIALMKNFPIGVEGRRLQFRFETFNAFNHPQWSSFTHGCSGATPFGGACGDENNVGNGEVTAAFDPRVVQVGIRLIF